MPRYFMLEVNNGNELNEVFSKVLEFVKKFRIMTRISFCKEKYKDYLPESTKPCIIVSATGLYPNQDLSLKNILTYYKESFGTELYENDEVLNHEISWDRDELNIIMKAIFNMIDKSELEQMKKHYNKVIKSER